MQLWPQLLRMSLGEVNETILIITDENFWKCYQILTIFVIKEKHCPTMKMISSKEVFESMYEMAWIWITLFQKILNYFFLSNFCRSTFLLTSKFHVFLQVLIKLKSKFDRKSVELNHSGIKHIPKSEGHRLHTKHNLCMQNKNS